jgi:hypothetical protein
MRETKFLTHIKQLAELWSFMFNLYILFLGDAIFIVLAIDPMFASSNPIECDGFLRVKKSVTKLLSGGSKAIRPMS